VAVDPSGDFVYTVELSNHRVQKFDSNGKFILKWGFEEAGGRQASRAPHSIAVDPSNNVYLADKNGDDILKFDANGKFLMKWGTKGNADGQFDRPHGIAFDEAGNVYVTDMGNFRIQKFDSNGKYISKIQSSYGTRNGQFSNTTPGIGIDSNENVYVIDKLYPRVLKFDANGELITTWGSKGTGDGQFKRPEDIVVDDSGNVFVSDTRNSRIQVFAMSK
jgi:tripartite motif-containing protein 71